MRNACRPVGRFFCLLMIMAAAMLQLPAWMEVAVQAQTSGPAMTQVADTVYRADGTTAAGMVLISWPAFTTADGKAVAAGSMSVHLGSGGAFAASLAPNTGAQPAGVYYKVVYQLTGQEPSSEYWVVPATGSTGIGAVRAKLMPPTVAAQVLTRDVADTNYVHVTGDQTVNGTMTFTKSPAVPTPQNPGDAANKAYVDAAAGSGINLASPAPIGSAAPNTGTFTVLNNEVNAAAYGNLSAACAAGQAVYLPAGNYAPASQIGCSNPTRFRGAGVNLTIIKPSAALAATLFSATGTAEGYAWSDMTIDMTNAPRSGVFSWNGIARPLLNNVRVIYPTNGTGTGTVIYKANSPEAHVTNLMIKGAGICVDVQGDGGEEDYWTDVTCESPSLFGYRLSRTTTADVGGEYLLRFKVTNPYGVSGSTGFEISSTRVGTLQPLWCTGCVADSQTVAGLYVNNVSLLHSSGSWYRTGNGVGLLLNNVTEFASTQDEMSGSTCDLQFAGTNANVHFDGRPRFAGSTANVCVGQATIAGIAIIDPVYSATPPMSAADNSALQAAWPSSPGFFSGGSFFRANNTVNSAMFGLYTDVPGANNPYKWMTITSAGHLQVHNSGNTAAIFDLDDAGAMTLANSLQLSNNTILGLNTLNIAAGNFLIGGTMVVDSSRNATVNNLTINGTCSGCGSGGGGGDLSSPPAIGTVTPNAGTFTTLTAQNVNGTLNAAGFPGADPCVQINNAIATLPVTGGVVDARGFQGAVTCTATMIIDRPVHLRFGAVQLTLQGNPGVSITSYEPVVVEGNGWEYNYTPANGRGTVLKSGSPAPLIVDNSSQGSQFRDVELSGNGVGTFGYFGLANGMAFDGVHAHGFQYTGIFAPGGMVHFRGHTMINGNGGDGLVGGGDVDIEGEQQVSHNGGNGVHIFGGSVRYNQPAIDNSGLHGLYFDGRVPGDWTANTNYLSPALIKPASGNPGGYYFYSYNVNGTSGSTAPAWPQSVGGTVNDGSAKWINVSTLNNGTAPHVGVANQLLISGGFVGNNGTAGVPGFVSDNVRLEGASSSSHTCAWNTITGLYVTQASIATARTSGVHLLNCDYTTISNLVWLGSGWDANSLPADQGGLVLENANFNSVSNYNAVWSTRSAVKLINSAGTQLDNVQSGGTGTNTTESPNNYAVQIDANSGPTQINNLTVDIWHGNEKGVYNRGALTSIDNYQIHPSSYGTTLDDLQYATLTNAHGRQPNVPVEFDIAGSPALAIDGNGNTTVSGDLSVRDIPGHAYFVSHYGSVQAAINAAYGTGVVSGKVIDDRTSAYSGAGFYVPDSVTVELAPVPYLFTGTVTHNNGNNNVTAAIVVEQGGHIAGRSTSSNHGTTIGVSPGFAGDIIATTSEGTGIGSTAQWWHWGSIENLNINGTGQASGRCLVVENMGETSRVENIEARLCYGNNIEIIGASATQSSIRNITTMRSQTASGVRFTNLAGVGKIDGLSGDCNPTSLVSVQENAAGSLTILGLKAEGEASICSGTVHDPVVLLDGMAGYNDHVRIIGGYAFGTSQANFAKFINAGNAILETEGLYITGYTNMLSDTVRSVTVPLSSSTSKQPFYYEPGGTTYANQAFTLTGGTFVQGSPAGTPTEIFGLTTGGSTLLAAAGNGDNNSILTGGIQISGQNRTSYGMPPEIMARWGYRWLGAGLGYDTTNFDLVPAWNATDTSTRSLGNALSNCQKGSTTVSCRWPNIYAVNVDTTSLTVNGTAVTIPTAGLATPSMDGTGAAGSSANFAREDHVHPSDTTRAGNGSCPASQFETGNTASGPSCAQVAYSQLSGAPTTSWLLNYQTNTATLVGNAGDQTIYTYTLPGGKMAAGTGMHCYLKAQRVSGTGAITYKWKFGGATVAYSSLTSSSVAITTDMEVYNNPGSTTTQILNAGELHLGNTISAGGLLNNPTAQNTASPVAVSATFNGASTEQIKGVTFKCLAEQ